MPLASFPGLMNGLGMRKGSLGMRKGGLGVRKGGLGVRKGGLGRRKGSLGVRKGGLGRRKGSLGVKKGGLGRRKGGLGRRKGGLGMRLAHIQTHLCNFHTLFNSSQHFWLPAEKRHYWNRPHNAVWIHTVPISRGFYSSLSLTQEDT